MQEIWVCQYDNCLRNRSAAVLAAFQAIALPDGVTVAAGGCQGQCHLGSNVQILSETAVDQLPKSTWYCSVKPDDVPEIVESHVRSQTLVPRLLNPRLHPGIRA